MSVIGKTWAYYREHGLVELARRVHRRRRFHIYVRDLTAPADVGAEDSEARFTVATAEQAGLVARGLRHWGDQAEQSVRQLIGAGDLAVVGITRVPPTKVVFVSWLSRRDPLLLTLHGETPPAGEICSRRIWVPTEHRRQGYARRGLRFAEQAAREAGYDRIWAFVIRNNKPSRRLHEQMGYDAYGVLRLGRVFGRRFAELQRAGERRWQPLTPVEP
ncbi:MAG: GNAT family N-acetyltransferase [Planctomycetota bacterium]